MSSVTEKDKVNDADDTKKEEAVDIEEKSAPKEELVSIGQLFSYATALDMLLIFFAIICSIAMGISAPLIAVIFGDATDGVLATADDCDSFKPARNSCTTQIDSNGGPELTNYIIQYAIDNNISLTNADADCTLLAGAFSDLSKLDPFWSEVPECFKRDMFAANMENVTNQALNFVYLGLAVMVVGFFQMSFWTMTAARQSDKMRHEYFKAIMKQDIGWFDVEKTQELATTMIENIDKVKRGMGEKLGVGIQWLVAAPAGIIIAFIYGWELSLVIFATLPFLVPASAFIATVTQKMAQKQTDAYAKSGSVAEETFNNVRTVAAFGMESKQKTRYEENLVDAEKAGIKQASVAGLAMGYTWFIMFVMYAIAFYVGGLFNRNDPVRYSAGTVLTVLFGVIIGGMSLGFVGPNVEDFMSARACGGRIFKVMKRSSPIDYSSNEGEKPTNVTGKIELQNVDFSYPARDTVQIFKNISLTIEAGSTVALVGASGSGKSTVVHLLQRLYDPDEGSVLIDDVNVKNWNIRYLRQQIGLVQQEPVLFEESIANNIKFSKQDASQEDVEKVAKIASIHEFIEGLPNKYDTVIGEKGAQLSGGQKQRIAIARALLRDPAILLFDEATSALDSESEKIVQKALDDVAAELKKTIVVVAHRLSTVRNSDKIIVFNKDGIAETGTHDELMKNESDYYNLVKAQIGTSPSKVKASSQEIAVKKNSNDLGEERKSSNSIFKDGRTTSVIAFGQAEAVKSLMSSEKTEGDPQIGRLLKLNKAESGDIVIGLIGTLFAAAAMPAFSVFFGYAIAAFGEPDEDKKNFELVFWPIMFVALGVVNSIGTVFQFGYLGSSGEKLTRKVRALLFESIIKQDMTFFDDLENDVGAITSRLSTDATAIQQAAGQRLALLLMTIFTLLTCLVIAFIYSWRTTLVVLGFFPILAIASTLDMMFMEGQQLANNKEQEAAGAKATEAISNIRTVVSLNLEDYFIDLHYSLLRKSLRTDVWASLIRGIAFSFSQSTQFFALAIAFWAGFKFIEEDFVWKDYGDGNNRLNFTRFFIAFSVIIFGAQGLGQSSTQGGDFGKANAACIRIWKTVDRQSKIDPTDESGKKPEDFQGQISIVGVKFAYPNRKDTPVLKKAMVDVDASTSLGLVGASGCGKSTIVQLIERFYDVDEGQILIDSMPITEFNLSYLRSKIGIVSQEPVLFGDTIFGNIANGVDYTPTLDEVTAAAKAANIHDFIETLPDKYDTYLGEKGTQISGGQKQRIAIARALIRNPKILLLDEATSALDTESEAIVQEALDKAAENRTSVVVAHRLQTIENCSRIAYLKDGSVVESGTHETLMEFKGLYYKAQMALHGEDS